MSQTGQERPISAAEKNFYAGVLGIIVGVLVLANADEIRASAMALLLEIRRLVPIFAVCLAVAVLSFPKLPAEFRLTALIVSIVVLYHTWWWFVDPTGSTDGPRSFVEQSRLFRDVFRSNGR